MTDKPNSFPQRPGPTHHADTAEAETTDAETVDYVVGLTADGGLFNAEAADVVAECQHPALTPDIDSEDFSTALREAREEANRKSDQPIPAYREYPPGEVSARAKAIYRDRILPRIEPPPKGVFVAIDIDSGDYEIHERDITAMKRLIKRRPIAMTFLMRVGYPAAYRHTGIRPSKRRPIPAQRA